MGLVRAGKADLSPRGDGVEGGGCQQSFIQVGSAPTSNPLPFYRPFYGEKVPFPVPSIDKWCPFSHT